MSTHLYQIQQNLYSTIFKLILIKSIVPVIILIHLYSTIFKLIPNTLTDNDVSDIDLYSTIFKLIQVHVYITKFQGFLMYFCRPTHFL